MAFILDAGVVAALRDASSDVHEQVAGLNHAVMISVVSLAMVEGDVSRDPVEATRQRARLNLLLQAMPSLPFDSVAAAKYGEIVSHSGFDRTKILHRMIAAQAIAHRATLVTLNADDFSDIRGLSLLSL